jgi:NAD(P)-dependent dehydrogenase (short-subunit alcohol dehydrogenase family)
VVAELDRPESPVRAVPCDVSNPAQVSDLFAAADEMGTLAAVVNSAAILERQCTFDQIEPDLPVPG